MRQGSAVRAGKRAGSALGGLLAMLPLSMPVLAAEHDHTIKIRIINAQTGAPVTDERLNVALKVDQIGSVAMATDKKGIIDVEAGKATILRILSNMYADCRPRSETYTNYSVATIRHEGITTGNLCSNAQPKALPGELILFEIPKRYVPVYPHPPASSLPHSDERPSPQ